MRAARNSSCPSLTVRADDTLEETDDTLEELSTDDAVEFDEPVPPGTVLGGRYVVGKVFAEGGMGVVCIGRHRELGHLVAVKFLRRDICDRPSIVQRFLNEAKAAAALRNDHVVRVLDVGQLDSGRPYLVMEHLEGEDLDRMVDRDGPLPVHAALEYVAEACTALAEAHEKGIVHRDIKPENLFLAYAGAARPSIKVVDFGLAKRIDASCDGGLTGPRDSMGSPCYMSPEQIAMPQSVDARTDIWSLGVTLYRLLTGLVPFSGDTVSEIFAHVLNSEPRPIYAVRRGLSSELDGIVRRCLKKDPDQRYQDVRELANALTAHARPRRRRSRSSVGTATAFADDSPVELPLSGPHRGTVIAAVLVASFSLGVYQADRTGRVDMSALAERALAPLLAIDGVRRFTDPWLTVPKLGTGPDEPVENRAWPLFMTTPFGVCAVPPAYDSDGRTVPAEPEHRTVAEPRPLGGGD